jgi:hypothetical protein
VGIERERDVAYDLPEESLAALAGDAFLDTAQQLQSCEVSHGPSPGNVNSRSVLA